MHERKPINRFNIQLKEAKEWEEKLTEKLNQQLSMKASPIALFFSRFVPLNDPGEGDIILQQYSPKIDTKVRHPQYCRFPPDFCIELRTGTKQGWFYTTDNQIYYGWKKEDHHLPYKNCLIDGYFLLIPKLRKQYPSWVETMTKRYYRDHAYATSERNGNTWITKNVYVPLREFPLNTIYRFNLDPDKSTKQNRLI